MLHKSYLNILDRCDSSIVDHPVSLKFENMTGKDKINNILIRLKMYSLNINLKEFFLHKYIFPVAEPLITEYCCMFKEISCYIVQVVQQTHC